MAILEIKRRKALDIDSFTLGRIGWAVLFIAIRFRFILIVCGFLQTDVCPLCIGIFYHEILTPLWY